MVGESLPSLTKITKENKEKTNNVVSQILLDIVSIALAISQVCDTWFNGTIFAARRAYLEAWQGSDNLGWGVRIKLFFADLLLCPLCLSHHVMFVLVAACWLPTFITTWGVLTMLPVYGLAALRLSFIINDTLPERARKY